MPMPMPRGVNSRPRPSSPISPSDSSSRASGPESPMRLKMPYVRTMKLVQNGTMIAKSSTSCARPFARAIVYATGNPTSRHASVALTDRISDLTIASRYRPWKTLL